MELNRQAITIDFNLAVDVLQPFAGHALHLSNALFAKMTLDCG